MIRWSLFVGSYPKRASKTVRTGIEALANEYGAEEVMLVNIMFEVIGGGTATLAVVPDASALSGPDNLVARVTAAADAEVNY